MSSAVGSACADLRQLLRVFTRPVIGRFSRLGLRSSRAHLTACAPGALAPSPLAGSIVQEGSPMPFLGPPVPSPRRQCIRSSLRLATGCGSAGTYPLGHAPVVTGFLVGTRQSHALPVPMPRTPRRPTPFHPESRTSPGPPSGRACAVSLRAGRCRITFPEIFLRALESLGRFRDCVPDGVGWERSFWCHPGRPSTGSG